MENLISEGSKDKPRIHFDKKSGILSIGGSSLPENVLETYTPVLEWIKKYSEDPNPETRIDFTFEYLNTASSHMVMQIVKKCLDIQPKCSSFRINWYYAPGDSDIKDFGEELKEILHQSINIAQV